MFLNKGELYSPVNIKKDEDLIFLNRTSIKKLKTPWEEQTKVKKY